MPRYVITRRYQAGERGPWEAGVEVELTEAEAEHLNRDSPGVARPLDAEPKQGGRDIAAPPQDRMVKTPSRRGKASG